MRSSAFVPTAVLGLGVLLISGMREQYAVNPRAPMNSITLDMAGMPVKDIVVSQEEQRVAGMSEYMLRSYGPDSAPLFTTYVGYYDRQVQGKSIHSPKNCLPGAGWEILESQRLPFPSRESGSTFNRVLLSNKGMKALVYYWYQGRGRIEASEYLVKWHLLRDAALRGRTEEALVRIVVPLERVADVSREQHSVLEADSIANSVAVQLNAKVERVLPRWNE